MKLAKSQGQHRAFAILGPSIPHRRWIVLACCCPSHRTRLACSFFRSMPVWRVRGARVVVEDLAAGCPVDSIFDHDVLNTSSPIAFIFGGEVGQLFPEILSHCDAGAFIPSTVEHAKEMDPRQHDAPVVKHEGARMHSCNVSVAACIVLSERFRRQLSAPQPVRNG